MGDDDEDYDPDLPPPYTPLVVFVADRDEDDVARLLGPDGEPIAIPAHKFGFQAEMVWI